MIDLGTKSKGQLSALSSDWSGHSGRQVTAKDQVPESLGRTHASSGSAQALHTQLGTLSRPLAGAGEPCDGRGAPTTSTGTTGSRCPESAAVGFLSPFQV